MIIDALPIFLVVSCHLCEGDGSFEMNDEKVC